MFKQCLQILVKAKFKTLERRTLFKNVSSNLLIAGEMAANPSSLLLSCWSCTVFPLSNTISFSLSCSGLERKEYICMNQKLSYCRYFSLGHSKALFCIFQLVQNSAMYFFSLLQRLHLLWVPPKVHLPSSDLS